MYAAMVEMVDRQIGEIMALLKELKIDDNTIVILCGDNGGQPYFKNKKHPHGVLAPNLNPRTGERFRGGKGNFYEGGCRIPFIAHWPGKIKAGSVSDHLGYFPDVMPTLAELAGAHRARIVTASPSCRPYWEKSRPGEAGSARLSLLGGKAKAWPCV